jgi:post-segregation antitoxin (ccd killing protein)
MTTLNITIPDELARDASAAGLLDPAVIQRLLRDGLRAKARAGLAALWSKLDDEELTPEIEAEIAERVRAVRSRRAD